jgi:enoyl-CoA hydratase/carnithine racemase
MPNFEYRALRVIRDGRIVTILIDNPPLNMLTRELLEDLDHVVDALSADPEPLVVVIKSSDPDIFMTHAEFTTLYAIQPPAVPATVEEVEINAVQSICERLRAMDKVSIAQVEGRVAGAGAAMVMACDMRFGALNKAVFNTMSVPLGTVPGGGASQYMPRLIGYSRSMELILGGLDLDAETAEHWGYLNRALAPDLIDAYVTGLASRISLCPTDAVRLTKEVLSLSDVSIDRGLREESFRFRRLFPTESSRRLVNAFLDAGGETREGELRIEALLGEALERAESERGTQSQA